MRTVLILFLFIPFAAHSQESGKFEGSGTLQVGLRTTSSLFGDEGYSGFGTGGQFRLRLGKRLNTEWFADYILTDIGGLGRRADGHIGWSVMFYPFSTGEKKITPYLLAGHCFDYTRVTPFNTLVKDNSGQSQQRWSSATQMGLGAHWHITEKFDISFSAQYMIHLGKDLHYHIEEVNGIKELQMAPPHDDATLEGHLLLTASLNIRIADLW
ncbi:MAG: hypothetical protein ACK40M_09165 [Flavobacteriales bacterium]